MSLKVSPLAPEQINDIAPIKGVRLGAVEAGIKYVGRKDLAVILFDTPAAAAGVFTKSKCPSAPVEWCRAQLPTGEASCVIINSGNANAFTGKKGNEAVDETIKAATAIFKYPSQEVYLASTGVIGEPLDASGFDTHLSQVKDECAENKWLDCAKAIMTTDTYPKLTSLEFFHGDKAFRINGIVKGSGMIAPDMATMLGYIVTDFPVGAKSLQNALNRAVEPTFNSITVDSDTSTSDSVMAFSTTGLDGQSAADAEPAMEKFEAALHTVCKELAMQVVRDGEGASKHVEVTVRSAASDHSAKIVALAIANSPLVKTAIAGQDANWGRIVMAVGKAGEPADRDKLQIAFGDLVVARNGERDADYSEDDAAAIMQQPYIPITVELGMGPGSATVWTCDLTKEYVAINGDYRS